MKPTIGRIVHYTPSWTGVDGTHSTFAAIITALNPDCSVALHVFRPSYNQYVASNFNFDIMKVTETTAAAGTEEAAGKWCWPAREP